MVEKHVKFSSMNYWFNNNVFRCPVLLRGGDCRDCPPPWLRHWQSLHRIQMECVLMLFKVAGRISVSNARKSRSVYWPRNRADCPYSVCDKNVTERFQFWHYIIHDRRRTLLFEFFPKNDPPGHPIFSLFDLCNIARPSQQQLFY